MMRRFFLYENVEINRSPRVFEFEGISDDNLRKRYRIGRESIRFIAALIEDEVQPMTNRNHAISTAEQVLVALRFFASGSFLQVIGDTFGYDKSTVSRIVRKVALALASNTRTSSSFQQHKPRNNKCVRACTRRRVFPVLLGASMARMYES